MGVAGPGWRSDGGSGQHSGACSTNPIRAHIHTREREGGVSGAMASNREKREEGGWGVALSWPSLSFVINGVDPSMRVSLSLIF
jgi:hypothetical protein